MERYKILSEIGHGTCGRVFKALSLETSEIVAIKKMKRKFYDWQECMSLREVKSLCKLNHQNIVKLKEIVRENNELFFVFEYMEHNLYQIMRGRQTPFSEEEIRGLMFQMLQGLAYMHSNGYFHRDLKPENLLATNEILKIADFGLAREVSSLPPYTDYVATRWYRAPEVLLQSSSYTPAIDMWAVGAILAELFTSCPIFPGESEMDQLYKICCVLGRPDWTVFPNATNVVDLSYFEIMPADLSAVIPNASPAAIDLIKQLCSWDPAKRPTANQCLQHPFFHVGLQKPPQVDPLQLTLNSFGSEPNLELSLWDFGSRTNDCFLELSLAVNPSVNDIEMFRKSHRNENDMVLYSGFQDDSRQSVFWSLFPPNNYGITTPLESSLSLSFSTIPNSTSNGGGVPHSSGFALTTSVQTNMIERPFLALSSSSSSGGGYHQQQTHCHLN